MLFLSYFCIIFGAWIVFRMLKPVIKGVISCLKQGDAWSVIRAFIVILAIVVNLVFIIIDLKKCH